MKPLSKSIDTRKYIINKISDVIRVKYDNIFLEINYNDPELKKDVEELMKPEYYSMNPKDILQPIEKELINKLKEKYPDKEFKVQKARVVKRKTPLMDKYHEADLEEEKKNNKLLEEKKEQKEKKLKELLEKKKYNTLSNNKRKKTKKSFAKGQKIDFSYNEPINIEEITNNLIYTKPPIQKIKPQVEKYVNNQIEKRHDLLDILKAKMEHNSQTNFEEENKKYENELKLEKKRKEEERNKLLEILQLQIKEKEQMKKLEKIEDKKFLRNLKLNEQKLKENELKKQIEKIEKNDELREINIEHQIQKQSSERALKVGQLKIEKMMEKKLKTENKNEDEIEKEKKKKYFDEILKLNNQRDYLKKLEKQKQIEEDKKLLKEIEEQNNRKEYENYLQRQKYFEKQDDDIMSSLLVKKMNELKEKKDNERYLRELSAQDLKRKIEYEEADKIRQKKVNDLK